MRKKMNSEKKGFGFLHIPWTLWVIIAVCVLAGSVSLILLQTGRTEKPDTGILVYTAKRGPLTISISESGTIKAREQLIIKNEVEGRVTILSLVPEGTRVKKGELLIELDASHLQDQKINEQINVLNAEASFVRARENLEVTKNQAQSDIEKAELTFHFAKEDLKKYIEGEYPKILKEAESRITIAQEEYQRATEKLKWSKVLFEEKYISQTELQADELAQKKAQLELELAREELALLRDYSYKRRLAELESDVRQAEMALERSRLKASADIVQAEADLRAKESEYLRQKSKLEKIEDQIAKTKMYAPADGLVVYATSAKADWRGNQEPLAEGQEVRERQELIYLPTGSSFIVDVKIHESNLEKIRSGLPVKITVDALSGKTFTGKVSKIAPLPDAQSVWLNPDLKVYNTEIYIENETRELRTGMSCRAEIIVDDYRDVLYVPVQAVLIIGGQPQVYVQNGSRTELRQVEIGLDNNRMVVIDAGLLPGERVLLTPPLEAAVIAPEVAHDTESSGEDRQKEAGNWDKENGRQSSRVEKRSKIPGQ
jgi:HlyD family secretion protein